MQDINWINNLKLRASWGQLGNINNVGQYDYFSSYQQGGNYNFEDAIVSGIVVNALETSLRQDASFHLNQRGATQQDAQGRWQFEYQLTRKVSDEHVL